MFKCPQCDKKIPKDAEICPFCSYELAPDEKIVKTTQEHTIRVTLLSIGFLVLFIVIIVTGYFIYKEIITDQTEKIVADCVSAADCELPGEYAAKSDCPYQVYCWQGQCSIGCPISKTLDDTFFSNIYPCQTDDDCDCTDWDPQDKYPCQCLNDQCVAIVDVIRK
ncbi:MAG: hypothetical protein GF365_02135 [Candidatus Buchananbacteria bacterium]|nr:hypothetical protein [Candidatus Buchananbacteria bacterium]